MSRIAYRVGLVVNMESTRQSSELPLLVQYGCAKMLRTRLCGLPRMILLALLASDRRLYQPIGSLRERSI